MPFEIMFFLIVGFIVLMLFIIRWLGAWLLRIDDVIEIQKHTLAELKKISEKLNKD